VTAKILEFKKPENRTTFTPGGPAAVKRLKSNQELFVEAYEDVIGDWQRFAAKNRLSEYVASKLPPSSVVSMADYVNDLNVLSVIEQKLGMKVSIYYPDCMMSQHGWMATVHIGKEIFSTPPDMASEANARALLIVLFLHFKAVLKSLGRDIS
jgi:hypothetical protein